MSRSVLKKIQLSLLALGLLGGGVIACGDDPAPAQNNNGGDGDRGGDGDGDDDEGDGDGDTIVETECGPVPNFPNLEGKGCKTSSGGQGFQLCENSEPTGECLTPTELISSFADASIPEIPDGGFGEAMDCPSSGGFECGEANVFGTAILPGQKTCNVNQVLFSAPPSDSACTNNGDPCTTMGLQGVCFVGLPVINNVCIQQCN